MTNSRRNVSRVWVESPIPEATWLCIKCGKRFKSSERCDCPITWSQIAVDLADTDGDITPNTRAAKALLAIYPAYDHDDLRTGLIDALSDVLHLCDLAQIDFGHALMKAQGHYKQEVHAFGVASDAELAKAIRDQLS